MAKTPQQIADEKSLEASAASWINMDWKKPIKKPVVNPVIPAAPTITPQQPVQPVKTTSMPLNAPTSMPINAPKTMPQQPTVVSGNLP